MTFTPAASLTEQIASHLGQEIIAGRIQALERIQEQKVARALGVSRGSVREALLILESRHLIDIIPRRGAVVTPLGQAETVALVNVVEPLLVSLLSRVADAWQERALMPLEAICKSLKDGDERLADAAQVLDAVSQFLGALLAIAGNRYLSSLLVGLLPVLQRVLHQRFAEQPPARAATVDYLDTLLDALHERDSARVGVLTRRYCAQVAQGALDPASEAATRGPVTPVRARA